MNKLDQHAETFFRKLIRKKGEGVRHFAIEQPGLLRFVVEYIYTIRVGENRHAHCWSLAFYGKMNGDSMRDPEMCFAVTEDGVYPYMYQNDYAGYYDEVELGDLSAYSYAQSDFVSFANDWMRELEAYGMLEAAVE